MIRIAQTFEFDERVVEGLPDWKIGIGLVVCLDVKETEPLPVEPGSTVRIHRPDGTFIDRMAKRFTTLLGDDWTVSLFLSNTKQYEVPSGSEIELPPFCIPLFPSPE